MSLSFRPSKFLRYALLGDAVASAATGLLMAVAAGLLADLLGLPKDLLRSAGLFLLPYAAIVAVLGTRERLSRGPVWAVIVANAAWVVGSVLFLLGGWAEPTGLGYGFVLLQALVVLLFAEAQYLALRRATHTAVLTG